jgi:hypothetical protein
MSYSADRVSINAVENGFIVEFWLYETCVRCIAIDEHALHEFISNVEWRTNRPLPGPDSPVPPTVPR